MRRSFSSRSSTNMCLRRLSSMQVAERNISDRLHALTAEARQFRQTSVTSELLDIISAYEALNARKKR